MKNLLVLLIFLPTYNFAQSGRIESHELIYKLAQRMEILRSGFKGNIGNGVLYRSDLFYLAEENDYEDTSIKDEWELEYIHKEIPEFEKNNIDEVKSFRNFFYQNPAYLASIRKKNYWFAFNVGANLFLAKQNVDEYVITNTRMVQIIGNLGNKIYFSSSIYENQKALPEFQYTSIEKYQTIPGEAFYKTYKFPILDNERAFDFLNADAHAGLNVNKFMNIEIGHGTHHIGYGDRSLLLSHNATNYFYLRLNTRFWKFNYQNLFKEIFPFSSKLIDGDLYFPKKYAASHLLTYQLNDDIELGLFETVVFARPDHFEFQYLNPIILYRSVEQLLNSSDNVLIGMQAKWNILNQFQIYGQVIIDEFNFDLLKGDFTWWGNKFGGQIGLKYINAFGVDHLDLQTEFNAVRPFTYTHYIPIEDYSISAANYSHHGQALAHPLGSNFYEWVNNGSYMISPRWFIHGRAIYSKAGLDSDDNFVGNNILIDGNERNKDEYEFLEGERFSMMLFRGSLQYMIYHNINIECIGQYRKAESNIPEFDNTNWYFGIGLRMNYFGNQQEY